jgi:hypothetical protein
VFGGTEALRETVGIPLMLDEQRRRGQWLCAARAALGEKAFEAARAEGHGMSWEQAVAYALEQTE